MAVEDVWIAASAVFGAILGSFLNVVIFRMPRGLSIAQPRWSFCPHCEKPIAFRDNIPVFGWLALRGKCRNCATPIGIIYPTIEAATALLFLMLADALFVGKLLPPIGRPFADWPIALAYYALFASLLAVAAMDVESYLVDIRVLNFAMIVGVIGTAVWLAVANPFKIPVPVGETPALTNSSGRLPNSLAMIGTAMGAIWCATAFVLAMRRRKPVDNKPTGAQPIPQVVEDSMPESPSYLNTRDQRFQPWLIILLVVMIVGMAAWVIVAPDKGLAWAVAPSVQRGIAALFVLMLLLLLTSIVHRESDQQIVDEIESERSAARPMALREGASFLPALAVGVGLFVYWRSMDRLDSGWSELMGGLIAEGALQRFCEGATHALGAIVWSAAIGWSVRIGGTLAFGKEAYGTGDIFIMAAIGAVMGIWALVFTFFLAAILAIMGIVATLFWKSSRAVPFGPWLALGAFATLWVYQPLLNLFAPAGRLFWEIFCGKALAF